MPINLLLSSILEFLADGNLARNFEKANTEEYQQLNKRLHRQGQTHIVQTIHISVGDVEEKLMRAIASKDITQAMLLESLKG